MKVINFIMGLIAIAIGGYALYVTIGEGHSDKRPGRATRIARAVIGLIVVAVGVLAILSATGIILKPQSPMLLPSNALIPHYQTRRIGPSNQES
jgi:hypothetical protein